MNSQDSDTLTPVGLAPVDLGADFGDLLGGNTCLPAGSLTFIGAEKEEALETMFDELLYRNRNRDLKAGYGMLLHAHFHGSLADALRRLKDVLARQTAEPIHGVFMNAARLTFHPFSHRSPTQNQDNAAFFMRLREMAQQYEIPIVVGMLVTRWFKSHSDDGTTPHRAHYRDTAIDIAQLADLELYVHWDARRPSSDWWPQPLGVGCGKRKRSIEGAAAPHTVLILPMVRR